MNREILMMIAMGSGILFPIGGYRWKWLRRYLLPVILGVVALLGGAIWWRALAMTVGLGIVFSLPYGDKTPTWLRYIVGISYVLPTFFLGFTFFQIVAPIAFIGLFKYTPWKIWEYIQGGLIGIIVARLLCN